MAVAQQTRRTSRQLLEFVASDTSARVDRDQGVIYGVKVLGLESENGRRYTPEAIRKAKKLYEGLKVNCNHPDKPTDSRDCEDRIGKLRNVRIDDSGLRADLYLLKTHPMTERLMEAAESMPEMYGLSHNAQGEGHDEDGVFVVEAITEVRSVDVVSDAASTRSLFESRKKTMKRSIKSVLESLLLVLPKHAKKQAKALLEMPEDELAPMDAEMDAPPPDDMPPPEEGGGDWKAHLTDAIAALVTSDDPASHDIAAKILKMLKPESAEVAEPTEPVAEGEGDEDKKDEDKKEETTEECDDKDKMEALVRENAALKRKEKARELCESLKFQPEAIQLKAIISLESEKDQKALIESLRGKTGTGNSNSNGWKPRPASVPTKAAGSFLESIRQTK